MAIGTDSTIDFAGTQDEVTTSPADVATLAYSIASDTMEWANDDDAPFAMFVLKLTAAGLGGAPDIGASISLFAQLVEIQAVGDDQLFPKANFEHRYLDTFPVSNADEDQNIVIGPVRLPNLMSQSATAQKFVFVIRNDTGVALGTTWQLYVTPLTSGPHA